MARVVLILFIAVVIGFLVFFVITNIDYIVRLLIGAGIGALAGFIIGGAIGISGIISLDGKGTNGAIIFAIIGGIIGLLIAIGLQGSSEKAEKALRFVFCKQIV